MIRVKSHDDFMKRWGRLAQEALARPTFEDDSEEARKKRLVSCERDLSLFASTYFPDHFRDAAAPFHKQWNDIATIRGEPVQVQAFRGAGKSTYFSLVDLVHRIAYGTARFIVLGSFTEEKARLFVARILLELMYNPRLQADFGAFFTPGQAKGSKAFVAHSGLAKMSTRVQAISIGQDPRGLVYGAYRPDTIRLDDIQSSKRAKSRKFVRETVEWVKLALIPALEADYSMIVCSTPLNSACAAMTLEKGWDGQPGIKTFRFPAEDKRGKPAWPARFPKDRLERIKSTVGSLFYAQEFLLVPIPADETIFREEFFARSRYELDEIAGRSFDAIVSWTDPSHKSGKQGDFKASVCVGSVGGVIYVLTARVRHESIDRMIDGMYRIYDQWNPAYMYYEDVGGQAILEDTFLRVGRERRRFLPVRPEGNSVNKEARIEGTLSALIENGTIRFLANDPDQNLIIEQLIQFPNADHDDGPDALEGAVRKLQENLRRLGPLATRRIERRSAALNGY
jgi:predicted phage terminase large subunit-like protein